MDFLLRVWREADSPPTARARSSASSISGSRFIHSLTLCDSGTPSCAAAYRAPTVPPLAWPFGSFERAYLAAFT